jgi:hypothetical protein
MTNINMSLHVHDCSNMPCHDSANIITNTVDFLSFYFGLRSNLNREPIMLINRRPFFFREINEFEHCSTVLNGLSCSFLLHNMARD